MCRSDTIARYSHTQRTQYEELDRGYTGIGVSLLIIVISL